MKQSLDKGTVLGLLLAVGGICGGLLLEGGKLREIAQPTAAMIVLGGTIGATMVGQPFRVFLSACKQLAAVVFQVQTDPQGAMKQIIDFANKARKNGIVSLEKEAMAAPDPFLRKALTLAVDGTEPQEIRRMMELEIALEDNRRSAEAKVLEAAGGYSPTIGIIGAVLGLIQVMKHLENIEEVGRGIAVAFVATIYGVALANVLLLPAAAKMKAKAHAQMRIAELTLEGVIGIAEGLNPKLILGKLEAYLDEKPSEAPKGAPARGAAPAAAPAPAPEAAVKA
ncbi:MAG TPA: flagellar motor protein [Bryobacterales bacterium]|nr:flagellar motor protein [Bryobacterales bacterium]